jgi:hypothetical protein
MIRAIRTFTLNAVIVLTFVGCAADTSPEDPDLTACSDPRPEMCTQDYRPVCAVLANGTRRTASNGCTACSDPDVTGWVDGACP